MASTSLKLSETPPNESGVNNAGYVEGKEERLAAQDWTRYPSGEIRRGGSVPTTLRRAHRMSGSTSMAARTLLVKRLSTFG